MRRSSAGAALVVVMLVGAAPRAWATIPIVDSEDVGFSLSGYVRNLSGTQHITYDTLRLVPAYTGVNLGVARFEWGLNLMDLVTLDIHDRFFWRIDSADSPLSGSATLGLGATTAPERNIDLQSTLLDRPGLLFEHDVDRLLASIYFDAFDLYVGRQAISWSNANLFPVNDLWAQFSPFELDTSQKRGIDAVRAIVPLSDSSEVDLLVADRGEIEDLSGGARVNFFLDWGDLAAGAAKIWNEIAILAAVSADLTEFGLRVETLWPYHLDREEVSKPRATVGLDWFGEDVLVVVEYHYNGTGVSDTADYLAHYQGEAISRGEAYLVGQHYAGLATSYNPDELVTLSLGTLVNLQDASAVLTPSASYQVSEDVDLSLGGFIGLGEDPVIALPPEIKSEFGTYGQLFYAQMAAFY